MKVTAKARGLKISARKLRNSADLIRNARVIEAEQLLAATPKKGAVMVADALKSAVANAENNHNLRKSGLRIAEIRVDEGSARKTWRPRSRGMAHPILHRSAHLTVVVSDDAVPAAKKVSARTEKQTKKPAPAGKEAK